MDRAKLGREAMAAGELAGWMEVAARRAAEDLQLELTPGRLCLAALIIAVTEARRGGLTLGQWRLLVRWLRSGLPGSRSSAGPAAPPPPAASAPPAAPAGPRSATSATATPGTMAPSPSAAGADT